MKTGLILLIGARLASAVSPDVKAKFDEFVKTFSKGYSSEDERSRRLMAFAENLVEIAKLRLTEDGTATYSHLTPFADLTAEEFSARHGFNAAGGVVSDSMDEEHDTAVLPDSFDWRDKGAVNQVKDQKQCGSCWAFATVANIEGAGFVSNKKLLSLSEQELVDCDHSGDQGCQGGLPSNAFKFLIQSKSGLEAESAYPYKAKNGQCKAQASAEQAFVGGWKSISTDEDQIAAALIQYGPLAIGINAGPMQTYSGGIAHPSKLLCNPSKLDHGVAIVGFGAESGTNYWVIRNSWGASWGEKGYYRIVRGVGACGLNTMVTTATQITFKDSSAEEKFLEFQAKFAKQYTSEERVHRMAVFADNLVQIEQLKALDAGSASYSHLTPFADISMEEFSERNGFQGGLADLVAADVAPLLQTSDLADSFDWRSQGAVNEIKDQKQCGSCWAFATVANIEGAGFVANHKLLSLSEQELVDCDHSGDQGCQGGLPSNAFKFLIQGKTGLEAEAAYPYRAKNGKCQAQTSSETAFISGWQSISSDEDQIGAALTKYGPLAIGINAGPMQTYSGGIAHPSKLICNPKKLDHGVAIVGFGEDSGTKYWVIRNSWGKSWGENGYYRIVRGVGACGLNTMVTTATGVTLKAAGLVV